MAQFRQNTHLPETKRAFLLVFSGALLLGVLSLLIALYGTNFMKVVALLSAIAAAIYLRRIPVFPFGRAQFLRRFGMEFTNPALRTSLERQKTKRLPLASILWLCLLAACGAVRFAWPASIPSPMSNMGHAFSCLSAWPAIQLMADLLFLSIATAIICMGATAYALWLFLYLLVLWKNEASHTDS